MPQAYSPPRLWKMGTRPSFGSPWGRPCPKPGQSGGHPDYHRAPRRCPALYYIRSLLISLDIGITARYISPRTLKEDTVSEFECINGHLMPAGSFRCPECGGRLYLMDGMTARQHEALDTYLASGPREPDEDPTDQTS